MIRNVSGTQTGALDPAKGMFWTWASGYVMAKLEGHSYFSTGIDKAFSYHTQLRIADFPACHSPGELARQIADNYEGMFAIESVQ